MAAKKIYAVKVGKIKGLFHTWDACKDSVDGYPSAEYKGFTTLEEAISYLGIELGRELPWQDAPETTVREPLAAVEEAPAQKTSAKKEAKEQPYVPAEHLVAYVDGSYDHSLLKYAFGCVFLLPDGRIFIQYGNGDNEQSLAQRNVAGEMLGAMYAVRAAMMSGYRLIEICYDYEGIEKWVTGNWKAKNELTQKYAAAMQEWRKYIEIRFHKVAAHTNVRFNELADQTAKQGLTEGEGVPKVCKIEEMKLWKPVD